MTATDAPRRRPRLPRGPLTIGEPAPALAPRLASAEPYRPDLIADGGTAFGLTVRAASVRGLSKRYQGGPRQDDLCLARHEASRTLVVAVADGVSGASRSEMGAALAVRYATASVIRQLDRPGRDPDEAIDWPDVVGQATWALVEEHRRYSGDPEADIADTAGALATTLLVASVTRTGEGVRVAVAAVGDSPALRLLGGTYTELAPEPERADGLVGGGIPSLPRRPDAVRSTVAALEPDEILLCCTDGISMPLAGGRNDVGTTLARELRRPPDIADFPRLVDFSRATYDDDRTLVAIWPAEDDGD